MRLCYLLSTVTEFTNYTKGKTEVTKVVSLVTSLT